MTTNQEEEEAVERQVRIRVPAATVYEYWTDPEKMVLWQGMEATLEPRPGGIYRVNVTGRDITLGEFLEVAPGERLVFTWGFDREGHPIPAGSTRVEIDFLVQGDLTVVRVRHHGIAKAERLNTAYGWQHYLTRLGLVTAGRDPGPDPWMAPPKPVVAPEPEGAEAPAAEPPAAT